MNDHAEKIDSENGDVNNSKNDENDNKKFRERINLDICFEDYHLIRPNFIPKYTDFSRMNEHVEKIDSKNGDVNTKNDENDNNKKLPQRINLDIFLKITI